jgi:cytochrome c biogenesis protein CcmG/thiol:disulfide interchange protein DsbE
VVTPLKTMHRTIIKLLFPLLALLLVACGEEPKAPVNGEASPAFTLQKLEGGSVSFPTDLSGKVVAIRFWADWCPFCESEMRQLEPVYTKYQGRGLVILAINVRQERPTVDAFVSKLNISYDTLLDIEGEVARSYAVMGLPTTYFVDRGGKLKSKIIGESTPEAFEQIIQGML